MKNQIFHMLQKGTLFCLLVLAASGCTFLSSLKDRITNKPADFLSHTVKWKGETLSIVAKWYTGSLDNWKKIAAANPDLDPARIAIGSKIRIPDHLLKTRKPMPKKYIDEFNIRQNIKTGSPESAPRPDPPDRPSGIPPDTPSTPEPEGKSAIVTPETAPPPPEPRNAPPGEATGATGAAPVKTPDQSDKKTEPEKGSELFGPKDFSR